MNTETKQENLKCAVGMPFDRIEVWKLWTNWEPRWGVYRIVGAVMTMVSFHPTKKEAFAAAKKLGTNLGKKAFMVEEVQ